MPSSKSQHAVSVQVIPDLCAVGKGMADATVKAAGKNAQVSFFTGTPGNPQGRHIRETGTDYRLIHGAP